MILYGSQPPSHNGGTTVTYQDRKKAKPTNQLVITDKAGKIIGMGLPQAGHHHDNYQVIGQVKGILGLLGKSGFKVHKALIHADKSFDNNAFRKYLWHTGLMPNIVQNKRNPKRLSLVRGVLLRRRLMATALYWSGLSGGLTASKP